MKRRRFLLSTSAYLSSFSLCSQHSFSSLMAIHVPAEENTHELTFMQWPVSREVYTDSVFLQQIQRTIATIANTIHEFEPVVMLAAKDKHPVARKYLSQGIELWDIATEDLWCRDSGPLFAVAEDGSLAVSHIQFNGWGNKQVHQHDRQIAVAVAAHLNIPVFSSGLQGEAGGIEHDGHGLLMAHESSWINENRNPNLSKAEIEEKLLQAYGASRCIWSKGVFSEDITDYHIDSLARFTGNGRVLMNLPKSHYRFDPFHQAALETHRTLVDAGLSVDILLEPNQPRILSKDFVASYVNYYVCNGAVITAQFGDKETDKAAVDVLAKHYPGREIVALNVDTLGEIGGGIHCATQQMPAV